MDRLEIVSTSNTPSVEFNPKSGLLKMEGRAIPENPGDFFDSLIVWLKSYFNTPAKKTVLEINLEYVNSGSSKYLLGVFRILKEAYRKGNDVEVRWLYEEDDEAIEGLGEHYKSADGIPFNLVEYI